MSQAHVHCLRDLEYLGADILLGGVGEFLLLPDAHVSAYAKFRRDVRDADATSPGVHPLPFLVNVRKGHSRRRHVRFRKDSVILGLD